MNANLLDLDLHHLDLYSSAAPGRRRPRAKVDCWRCAVADGLIGAIGRAQKRALAAIDFD